jgi:hypothetical protein
MLALLVLVVAVAVLLCGFVDGFAAEAAEKLIPMVVSYLFAAIVLFIVLPAFAKPLYLCLTAMTALGIFFGAAHGRWVRRKLGGGQDE